jgi:hypothetical protein
MASVWAWKVSARRDQSQSPPTSAAGTMVPRPTGRPNMPIRLRRIQLAAVSLTTALAAADAAEPAATALPSDAAGWKALRPAPSTPCRYINGFTDPHIDLKAIADLPPAQGRGSSSRRKARMRWWPTAIRTVASPFLSAPRFSRAMVNRCRHSPMRGCSRSC